MIELEVNREKKVIEVFGGTGKISDIDEALQKIDSIDTKNKTISQIFDASTIAGKKHLIHASKLALKAIENNRSFADSKKIELTCWTAGLRQINKAISQVGLKENTNKIAFITIGESDEKIKLTKNNILKELEIEEDSGVLEMYEEKKKDISDIYSIPEDLVGIYPLQGMVLEKIALLSLET